MERTIEEQRLVNKCVVLTARNERLAPKGLEATECRECGDYCEKVLGSEDDICGRCENQEEVYLVVGGVDEYVEGDDDLQMFRTYETEEGDYKTTYFQTYGGGPEGGYFLRTFYGARMCDSVDEVYSVKRKWGSSFTATKLNGVLDYNEKGDGTAGTIRFIPSEYMENRDRITKDIIELKKRIDEQEDTKCGWCNSRGVDTKNENGIWIHSECGK